MTLLLSLILFTIQNHPPVLSGPLVQLQGWPYEQQMKVMEDYKRTGVLYKYPAYTGENPFEGTP